MKIRVSVVRIRPQAPFLTFTVQTGVGEGPLQCALHGGDRPHINAGGCVREDTAGRGGGDAEAPHLDMTTNWRGRLALDLRGVESHFEHIRRLGIASSDAPVNAWVEPPDINRRSAGSAALQHILAFPQGNSAKCFETFVVRCGVVAKGDFQPSRGVGADPLTGQ